MDVRYSGLLLQLRKCEVHSACSKVFVAVLAQVCEVRSAVVGKYVLCMMSVRYYRIDQAMAGACCSLWHVELEFGSMP